MTVPIVMVARLAAWIPHEIARGDPETRRRAALIVRGVTVLAFVYPVMTVVYAVRGHWAFGIALAAIWCLLPLPLVVLRRTKQPTWGAHTLVFILWATFLLIAAFTGGTHAPVLSSNAGLIVTATMLAGVRGGVTWAAIVVVTLISTLVRTKLGLGVTQVLGADALLEFRTAEPMVAGFVMLVTCVVYERLKERMFQTLETERSRVERLHADTKLLLDNSGQGFVTLDTDGVVIGAISATAKQWLPSLHPGVRFADVVGEIDASVGATFDLCWEALIDDILPLELNLAQMPSRLHIGDCTYSVAYRPLIKDDTVERAVIIITDITAKLAQDRAEANEQELLEVFRQILSSRDGVAEFLDECGPLVGNLAANDTDLPDLMRALHTLKGNSALVGLRQFANQCHRLESDLAEGGRHPNATERAALAEAWDDIVERIRPLLRNENAITLDADVYQGFLQRLAASEPHDSLVREARLWSFEALDDRFRRLGDHAIALCERLGKGELRVRIDTGGLRLEADDFGPFWSSLTHVIRNAVDHGIETPEERRAAGKSETPVLSLRAHDDQHALVIEIADDGRGVRWDKVRDRALSLAGCPHDHQEALEAALFMDGVSSAADNVTAISGRGVGLAAVKHACEALGGQIAVVSEDGKGTQFQFRFPHGRVSAGALGSAA